MSLKNSLNTITYSSLQGFITSQHNGQLLVGLLAWLVEHCTRTAEVMGSNHVNARMLFRTYFHNAYVVLVIAEIAFIFM